MKDNQRIRISKKLLKDSLVKLLDEKSIHKISVIEICNEAQINRTTFYKYYGSQYDLLGDMENDVLFQIETFLSEGNVSADSDRLVKTFTFINDNLELCRILLNNNVDPEFPERLIKLPSIQQLVLQRSGVKFNEDELVYILGFVVDGGFGTIKRWMNKENRETPEEIATHLHRMSMKLFS